MIKNSNHVIKTWPQICKVISGSKVLFGSKIVQCFEEQSFGQLLSQIEGELFAEKQVASVKIGEGKQHEVQLDAMTSLTCLLLGMWDGHQIQSRL